MERPGLAVCIPTYNRAEILADRLERLRRVQDRIALEVCISDNASTDKTPEVAERFEDAFSRFRYLRHAQPISPQINFYTALRCATFPFAMQIGDDDLIIEETVCHALALLAAEPELQAVFGNSIDYDFAGERLISETFFITQPERYTADQAGALFNKYYFLEYVVARRSTLEAGYYNEGMSYPTGWRLIEAVLRRGPIRLEPMPLVRKGVAAFQVGASNYVPELGAIMRADLEWFAACRLPEATAPARAPLARAALARSVRYSSDSTISAILQKRYLAALHHAQKAALYDYDTHEYPHVALDDLIYGRLGEWLRQALAAAPDCASLRFEDHPACRKLWACAADTLPQIRDCRMLPPDALEIAEGSWTVSFAFAPELSRAALRIPGAPYSAVLDMLRNSTLTSRQFARLTGVDDDGAVDDDDWSAPSLALLLPEFAPGRPRLVPAGRAGGAPIASGDGAGSPEHAFDGDPASFWISAERRGAVKDRAWIGYSFGVPQAISAIRVTQDYNPGYRQDRMRVEQSRDGGGTWRAVAPAPFRIAPGRTTIKLPAGEPARLWRLVAAGDDATEPDHGWTVMGLEFFTRADAPSDPPVPADLAGGAAVASSECAGSPDRAFDDDPENFWISAERCDAVKGRAWIGYSFAVPQQITAIRITQDTNPGYRQDYMRVENSADGGETWQPAADTRFRLIGRRTTVDLPVGKPARMWRLVAAGDNATEPDHGWTVMGVEFFAAKYAVVSRLAPVDRAGGVPMASGAGPSAPERAFDDDLTTFWISAERCDAVKEIAWIGYRFAAPQAIGAVRITQDLNPGYHQDRMRVEKSNDGAAWEPAGPGPFRLIGARTTVDFAAGEPALMWRLVAAGDNAVDPDHGWTVLAVEFFALPPGNGAADGQSGSS